MKWKIKYMKPVNETGILRNIKNDKNMDDEEFKKFIKCSEEIIDPYKLVNMDKCVEEIKKHKKILVSGDYDADGIMATVIMYIGLKQYGFDVCVHIPERSDGYGIKNDIVDKAERLGCDCIITVDNGIACKTVCDYAKEKNIAIIITDHHQPTKELPCEFVVDPQIQDYPVSNICGAFVAYKFISAFVELDEARKHELIEFATIATVADVMPLVGENRTLVHKGLQYIKRSNNAGIRALLNILRVDRKSIEASTISFSLSPVINASGRMDSPMIAYNTFITENDGEASSLAKKLCSLNEERKKMQLEVVNAMQVDDSTDFIIANIQDAKAGILGLIAQEVTKKFGKPCFALTKHGKYLGGSGRSINNFNIFNLIDNHRDIVFGGGHAEAAGIGLEEANLAEFQEICNKEYREYMKDYDSDAGMIEAICEIDISMITDKLINNLNCLEPCGNNNIKPVFYTNVIVEDAHIIGKNKNALKFIARQNGCTISAIGFNNICEKYEAFGEPSKLDILYTVGYNYWNDSRTKQIMLIDIRMPEKKGSED